MVLNGIHVVDAHWPSINEASLLGNPGVSFFYMCHGSPLDLLR